MNFRGTTMNKFLIALLGTGLFTINAQAFEPGEISASKSWKAEVVENHEVWNKSACVAYTTTEDELSRLEVTSFYNEDTKSFTEPTINILTPFDVVFFEVSVSIDRIADDFTFFPILPNSEDTEFAGARGLFDDRQNLVDALEDRNIVTAKYFDTEGEVKSLRFSLSGSGATIRDQREACGLEITQRQDITPLPLP